MNQEKQEQDYMDGWNAGKAGKPLPIEKLALGANGLNQYERGWVDSGRQCKPTP